LREERPETVAGKVATHQTNDVVELKDMVLGAFHMKWKPM
jgi:hypothetical protein